MANKPSMLGTTHVECAFKVNAARLRDVGIEIRHEGDDTILLAHLHPELPMFSEEYRHEVEHEMGRDALFEAEHAALVAHVGIALRHLALK